MGCSTVFWWLFLSTIASSTQLTLGYKILVTLTPTGGSHFLSDSALAKTLSARGHKVWVLLDNITYHRRTDMIKNFPSDINFVVVNSTSMQHDRMSLSCWVRRALRGFSASWDCIKSFIGQNVGIFNAQTDLIDDLFASESIMRELKSVGFDMITGDSVHSIQVALAQVLQVPFIIKGNSNLTPSKHDRLAHNDGSPSYVPARQSHLTDSMNFRERLRNTIRHYFMRFFDYRLYYKPMQATLRKHNIRPEANMQQLLEEAAMWICSTNFVVDFPRPLSPHLKIVGGFLTGPADPLTEEWQSFVDSSGEHGIVVFSLGTTVNDEMTDEQVENLATSLSLLPQNVAWGFGGKRPKTLGNNTKIVKWIPQNDLLGHPKAKLFITHGGMNSLHQSVYHGVPVVGLPIFTDQRDNLVRLEAKGMAIYRDIQSLTNRAVYDAAMEVIYNKTYKESAERYSGIVRDRMTPMTPMEETAYWIEYAIKHGTSHLKPRSMQLTTVQFYLLDVVAFYVLILLAVCWIVTRVFCCAFRRCCKTAILKNDVRKQDIVDTKSG